MADSVRINTPPVWVDSYSELAKSMVAIVESMDDLWDRQLAPNKISISTPIEGPLKVDIKANLFDIKKMTKPVESEIERISQLTGGFHYLKAYTHSITIKMIHGIPHIRMGLINYFNTSQIFMVGMYEGKPLDLNDPRAIPLFFLSIDDSRLSTTKNIKQHVIVKANGIGVWVMNAGRDRPANASVWNPDSWVHNQWPRRQVSHKNEPSTEIHTLYCEAYENYELGVELSRKTAAGTKGGIKIIDHELIGLFPRVVFKHSMPFGHHMSVHEKAIINEMAEALGGSNELLALAY